MKKKSIVESIHQASPAFKAINPLQFNTKINPIGLEERAERFTKRSIKAHTKMDLLKLALSMIDLTTLEGKDSEKKLQQLCFKAQHLLDIYPNIPTVAAVCVYPTMISAAKKYLNNSPIKIAAVATGFPSGQTPLPIKIAETKFAIEAGADEIDMVVSRGHFLSGEYAYFFDEIATIKAVCGETITLKVILETGELGSYENIRKASDMAMLAGADFIKTSTGKIQPAATLPVTLVMLSAIKVFYYATGKKIGMKPAGGIGKAKQAIHYLVMLQEILGEDWMNNTKFRFGASSLANDILMQIVKQTTGNYQSSTYFSVD